MEFLVRANTQIQTLPSIFEGEEDSSHGPIWARTKSFEVSDGFRSGQQSITDSTEVLVSSSDSFETQDFNDSNISKSKIGDAIHEQDENNSEKVLFGTVNDLPSVNVQSSAAQNKNKGENRKGEEDVCDKQIQTDTCEDADSADTPVLPKIPRKPKITKQLWHCDPLYTPNLKKRKNLLPKTALKQVLLYENTNEDRLLDQRKDAIQKERKWNMATLEAHKKAFVIRQVIQQQTSRSLMSALGEKVDAKIVPKKVVKSHNRMAKLKYLNMFYTGGKDLPMHHRLDKYLIRLNSSAIFNVKTGKDEEKEDEDEREELGVVRTPHPLDKYEVCSQCGAEEENDDGHLPYYYPPNTADSHRVSTAVAQRIHAMPVIPDKLKDSRVSMSMVKRDRKRLERHEEEQDFFPMVPPTPPSRPFTRQQQPPGSRPISRSVTFMGQLLHGPTLSARGTAPNTPADTKKRPSFHRSNTIADPNKVTFTDYSPKTDERFKSLESCLFPVTSTGKSHEPYHSLCQSNCQRHCPEHQVLSREDTVIIKDKYMPESKRTMKPSIFSKALKKAASRGLNKD